MSVSVTMSFSPSTVSPGDTTTVELLIENSAMTAVAVVEVRPTPSGQQRALGVLNGIRVPVPAEGSIALHYDVQAFEESSGHTCAVFLDDGSRASDSQTISVS